MGAAIPFVGPVAVPDGLESGVHAVAGRVMNDERRPPDSLLARAAGGDMVAFREIYGRHRADVARLVFRMLGGRSDVEDVIQEVFVQVFRSLKDFRGQSKFTTWLHRVTVNVVLMHRRAARSRPVFADEPPDEGLLEARGDESPDEGAARHERMRAFQRLLDRLPEKKRDVFVLHELEGHAPQEIAKIVGAPVLTVRTRLFYARRELQAMLAEEPALAHVAHEMSTKPATEPPPSSSAGGVTGGER